MLDKWYLSLLQLDYRIYIVFIVIRVNPLNRSPNSICPINISLSPQSVSNLSSPTTSSIDSPKSHMHNLVDFSSLKSHNKTKNNKNNKNQTSEAFKFLVDSIFFINIL